MARKLAPDVEHRLTRARYQVTGRQFSSFNEQKLITEYLEKLQIAGGTVVDIGAGNGIRRSNTFDLVRKDWRVLGVEYDSRNAAQLALAYADHPNAFAVRCKATKGSTIALLQAYDVELDFAFLSLDIDGYDYWLLSEILQHYRPKLIVSEYNEKIPPPIRFVVNYDEDFELRHHFYGYSIAQLDDLLETYDYALLEVEYNNVFLAPAELAGPMARDIVAAYRIGYLDRPDRRDKFPSNADIDAVHRMPPEDALQFLKDFYARFDGEFRIGIEKL